MGIPRKTSAQVPAPDFEHFSCTLKQQGLTLARKRCRILQINVGLLCDLACRHCHLEAGPHQREKVMSAQTMKEVVAFARRSRFELVDITGGAPELVPGIEGFLADLAEVTPKLMLRSNLTALNGPEREQLLHACIKHRVALVVSFPALREAQIEAQRGSGVWEKSLAMLHRLNDLGYGCEGSGLELHLAVNPGGAFLPANQGATEKRYRRELHKRWGLVFNNLFTLTNTPLGRFQDWLENSGNYEGYMRKLAQAFNPETIPALMCREQISISWDGYVFDCDFHLAAGICRGEKRTHVRDLPAPPAEGTLIATADHCYACTAGAGFT
ncbi:radical SAM/Cys-rich domain-containing protein [Geoalkalibacter ferrihydriticus]|uniref:Radical SAM protein n=2 Tax=Geoalkalibacter ferrihydriticus TaxID=392333 RepID=A0A0C2DR40_9BACT|nr:arsenosugar biosynthesis radical SAM (seleno)protein ArsS [Geoalkalibacter ferrihydriticus]KIH75909.1 radical SAM protein [Geoalkalibacter ferrihydriticus DSM 17813]SDM54616.1 radical SAM/Cys-rich domain-containing protein [Geoalkalibacter ferrihydriticus]